MKHLLLFCAAVLLTACATTGTKSNPLVGTWTCEAATRDGRVLPEETIKLLRLTLTGDRFKTSRGKETLFDSVYAVETTKNPKQINMVGTEVPIAGQKAQGIYELDGDTLRMCYTMPGRQRPATFDSPAGSGAYLIVWKRAKP